MHQYISSALAWIDAHPAFASVIFWPILTAIVTWCFKPRSPEEYLQLAATHPRTAKLLRLVGALGLDAPKVLQILGDMVKRQPPKSPPSGPDVGPLVAVILGLGAIGSATACASWGSSTCKVLDLANSACPTVVQFVGDDGKLQQVTLTRDDVAGVAARRVAARDAGAGDQ